MIIEEFWNIIHYNIYKIDYKLHLAFNKINPGYLLLKIPLYKKLLKKKGGNTDIIHNIINTTFKDPRTGISSLRAATIMQVIPMVFCFALQCYYIAFVAKPKNFVSFLLVLGFYSIGSTYLEYS